MRRILVFLVLVGCPMLCPAQYYNPYYNPYQGPYGVMAGRAEVINANSQASLNNEQARIVRQQSEQAKIQTKKQAFDEMQYEKANTPTYTENKLYQIGVGTQRIMKDPVPAEVTEGKSLNVMLRLIREMMTKGAFGPPVMVDQEILKHINVTIGSGQTGSNLGMLKDGGELDWPLVLQGPKQEKVDKLLPTLVSQANLGKIQPKVFDDTVAAVADVRADLKKRFHQEKIDGGRYLTGTRFLDPLEKSIKALEEPASAKLLRGQYAARGRTVPEVVENMTRDGLAFAPANPPDQAAYYSLHHAFVAYAGAAQSQAGFQVNYVPPRTEPYANK